MSEKVSVNRAQLFTDSEGKWRFRILAGNNEIVAESEGYSRRQDARHEVEQLGISEERIEIMESE